MAFKDNQCGTELVSRLGLPSKYDYWLAEYSPIIPQNSTTTSVYCYALCDVYICIMFNVCLRKMWCIVAAGQTN